MLLKRVKRAVGLNFQKLVARDNFLKDFGIPLVTSGGESLLTLSFDCDVDDDMIALPALIDLLGKYSIKASFALCGALIQGHEASIVSLISHGHEIINHGYSRHSSKDQNGAGCSTLFYHNLADSQIEDEIARNHTILKNTFSIEVKGFRTPHFGTFSGRERLSLLYRILSSHGYLYSTSTCGENYPLVYSGEYDMMEIPLTQCPWHRGSPFDSWHILKAPGREHSKGDLFTLFKKMLMWLKLSDHAHLVNLYFDPSHIMDEYALFEMLLTLCKASGLITCTYSELYGILDLGHYVRK